MLTPEQSGFFDDNGYVVIPDAFSNDEVDLMRRECARIASDDNDQVVSFAGINTFYRCHERDGKSGSDIFHVVSRLERTLGAAQALLKTDDLYVFNSRLYCKNPLVGAAMMWHQDFGYWRLDRVPQPNMLSVMVMLGDVDILDGCLWVVPGSHKAGALPHYADATTPFKQWPVKQATMSDVLNRSPKPLPITGKRGTMAIHHALTIHASGHNLAADPRWLLYLAYNETRNAPAASSKSRPDFISSRNTAPLSQLPDAALTNMIHPVTV